MILDKITDAGAGQTSLYLIQWNVTKLQYKTINLSTGVISDWIDVPTI
jgi:hypothetical protein